ncbi:hypothetical protein M569_05431 [Genlisea aurea]|uniref:Uncharacterized protein n=1 Tax=Genlisea aurea TaxID=192259 RepID=S8CRE7_9LAMI|nr:hypothetical protein M569_05431 [Genlisea aurea]
MIKGRGGSEGGEKSLGCKLMGRLSNRNQPRGEQVKIKIPRRELEAAMKRAEAEGLTMEEILYRLMVDAGDRIETTNRRSWRPALYSIPE